MRKDLLICCFFIILGAPLMGMLATPPAHAPSWRSFKQLEYYFFDHMGFKSTLNKAYSNILYHGLGTIPFSHVVKGKGGMLFHQANITEWCSEHVFNPFELQQMAAELYQNQEQLQKRNIKYLIVLAPMKEAVYQNLLPANKACAPAHTRLQQFDDVITIPHINPLKALRTEFAPKLSYLTTDHRVNGNGQVVLYNAILRALEISPATVFATRAQTLTNGSLSQLINVTISEPYILHTPQNVVERDESIMVIDSGHLQNVTPMLKKHFTSSEVIEKKYGYALDMKQVDELKPNIVIHQIVLEGDPYTL